MLRAATATFVFMNQHKKILFICKKNEMYSFVSYTRRSSGLYNSTQFIVSGLREKGIEANIIEVQDNNCIDKYVTRFKPDIVIIEALWVVPEKFLLLKKLHPQVKWFVHLHSHMPFLAMEGIAMDWIQKYAKLGIKLIANSEPSFQALRAILTDRELTFLPNVYISNPKRIRREQYKTHVDIGCFGAIRPLKNQLLQALAAIGFARQVDKKLRFHINGTRVETGGEPVLKNLRQLFAMQPHAELVEHRWNEPEDFINLLHSKIDLGMQVSLTETFSVVSADYVTAAIPMVVSKEVMWASKFSKAADDSIDDIVKRMNTAMRYKCLIKWNQRLLAKHSNKAQASWYDFVRAI